MAECGVIFIENVASAGMPSRRENLQIRQGNFGYGKACAHAGDGKGGSWLAWKVRSAL
jgi:hypothetical protein